MPANQLFFVSQKAFIQKEGKILILFDTKLKQDLPGGRMQQGEKDLQKALRREIKEELGFEIEIGQVFALWHFSPWKKLNSRIFCIGFKCKYLSGNLKLSKEHSGYKWVDKTNFKKVLKKGRLTGLLEKYFKEI